MRLLACWSEAGQQNRPPFIFLMTSSEIFNLWCYTSANGSVSPACSGNPFFVKHRWPHRHREPLAMGGSMESIESVFTGPMLYLAIAWAAITVIFMALMIWRTLLTSHEDDQIFLSKGEDYMAREQQELIARITRLARPIMTTGIASGGLLLLIVGMFVYQGLKHF